MAAFIAMRRPTHEYLGFSAGLDFETRILVKHDAPELLRRELMAPGWQPRVLGLSGVTDPYQPVERRLRLTRRCLEVLAEFRQAVAIVTKNRLVTRDLDLLGELARHQAAGVILSITTLDAELAGQLEPRTTPAGGEAGGDPGPDRGRHPGRRDGRAVIPGLTEHEMPAILEAAAEAGAAHAGYILLRLPLAVVRPLRGLARPPSARTPRRRSWAGSGRCATAGSTTRGSASGCAARARSPI